MGLLFVALLIVAILIDHHWSKPKKDDALAKLRKQRKELYRKLHKNH